jgi:DNA-damage-inducible protein J
MAKTETVYTRIEPDLKKNVEKVLSCLGMTPSDAINIFFSQIVLQKGLPFEVRIPQMTVEQAKAELLAELKSGDESIERGEFLSMQKSKSMLGL